MWYIYESSISPQATMNPDSYPVPPFLDAASAGTFSGINRYGEKVKFIAAKVDEAKTAEMPDYIREDYEKAVSENANCGDFVLNPHKLR